MIQSQYLVEFIVIVISLGGSAIINLVSIRHEWRTERVRARKRDKIESWEEDTASNLRQLWTCCIRLPPNMGIDTNAMEVKNGTENEEMVKMKMLIENLEKLRSEAPSDINGEIQAGLDDVIYQYHHGYSGSILSHEFSGDLQEKISGTLSNIANHSDSIERGVY